MAGEDLFRKVYPGILDIDMALVEYLGAGQTESQRWWIEVYRNMLRAKAHPHPVGWVPGYSPLSQAKVQFTPESPPMDEWTTESLNYSYRGNAFFGIGVWSVAEEYYRVAMDMAIYRGGEIGAFQNAANLGMCYLGAEDYESTLRVTTDILEAACRQSVCDYTREEVIPQALTEYCLACVALGKETETPDVLRLWSARFWQCRTPQYSVYSMLKSVFDTTGALAATRAMGGQWAGVALLFDLYA